MSLADYADREIDALALRGANMPGEFELSQTLFGADYAGEICTGAQKLAQCWTLLFMTKKGSIPYNLERGTDFLTVADQGLFVTEADVQSYFNFAELDIRRQLTAEELETDSADERYDFAALTKIFLLEDSLAIYVTITSRAGSARKVILPLPVLPLPIG